MLTDSETCSYRVWCSSFSKCPNSTWPV